MAGRPGHRRRARPRPTGPTRCSTPTATTRSSATGSWPTRPARPVSRWPSAPRGGSARSTGWWSAFGKKRGKNGKAGPPVHDDLVERDFTADAPNRLWLADITEHRTGEGKLYLCAIKDVFSNRIVGYSIDSRMKSRLAATALHNAVARRGEVAGCILHTDRGSQFRAGSSSTPSTATTWSARWAGSAPPATTPPWSPSSPAAEERPRPPPLGHPRGAADRDRHLDRTDLPPPPPTGRSRPVDPHRIRNHHDHTGHSGRVTETVTYRCSRPLSTTDRKGKSHV